ncbi:MAG: hypothetical protein NTX53_20950 [candidate division WOR-3 bacterium]|nr:hypothetical protein [candidate division WOR-3 bacterium]
MQFEPLRVGSAIGSPAVWFWGDTRVLRLALSYKSLQLSGSLMSVNPVSNCIFPAEVGYILHRSPLKYGPFYGMVPEVRVEAGCYVTNGMIDDNPMPPMGKLGIRAGVDFLGLGAGIEVAAYAYGDDYAPRFHVRPAVSASISLITNFGF